MPELQVWPNSFVTQKIGFDAEVVYYSTTVWVLTNKSTDLQYNLLREGRKKTKFTISYVVSSKLCPNTTNYLPEVCSTLGFWKPYFEYCINRY